jgi:predicted metal-binding membrane protein
VASRTRGDIAKDRLPDVVLTALVVLVLLAWGSTLVYLGLYFL